MQTSDSYQYRNNMIILFATQLRMTILLCIGVLQYLAVLRCCELFVSSRFNMFRRTFLLNTLNAVTAVLRFLWRTCWLWASHNRQKLFKILKIEFRMICYDCFFFNIVPVYHCNLLEYDSCVHWRMFFHLQATILAAACWPVIHGAKWNLQYLVHQLL